MRVLRKINEMLMIFILFAIINNVCDLTVAADLAAFKSLSSFRECFAKKSPGVCVKEKALDALNETIYSDKPIVFYDLINVERNPNFDVNETEAQNLPEDAAARSLKLSDILYDKVEEFFKSRVIKFNMAAAVDEGRAKKDKGKGGMMMLGIGAMACMVAQLFMGKVAFLAGTALILAKVALLLSGIVGLKKLTSGSGGGGETSHVVYASSGDYGHSHGGGSSGGWHRSLNGETQAMMYKGYHQPTDDSSVNYGY